ncbi:MAG TPA: FG-GAP repeat protein, partial [Polyangiaceae bacterium]|nr:FG-GAP repeat protein [Polyangiaceae bacterium]
WRTTQRGSFVGAVDVVSPGPTTLANRWRDKRAIDLPNFGAGDRAGQAVALAPLALTDGSKTPLALVGTPGASSPTHLRAGAVDIFAGDGTHPVQRITVDQDGDQIGTDVVSLDFDGDGQLDLAVAAPNETAGGPEVKGFADPDGCSPLDAKGNPTRTLGRGVVRIYSRVGGAMVERFRLTAPREAHRDPPQRPYARSHFGYAIAAADVNGDKKDDLVVGRIGHLEQSGAEIVLGRKPDPSGRVLIVCNTGETGKYGAIVMPAATLESPTSYGPAVSRIGDLDKDGCDEVAMSIVRSDGKGARSGVAVAFGYDATGAHCRGHEKPFVLHLSPDDHKLADNVVGDPKTQRNDLDEFIPRAAGVGHALAHGAGDFTGDGVPDLVVQDNDLASSGTDGPAVEIISGAYLAGLCPNRACPKGRHDAFFSDGDWHVLGLRPLPPAVRRIIPSGGATRGGIVSMTLADVTGDGIVDLAVGAPDDSDEGPFSGEVRIYRGGKNASTQEALLGDPFLIAVGDITERGAFGTSIALGPMTLLVGAPMSTRKHTGGSVGAAYRWAIEVPR